MDDSVRLETELNVLRLLLTRAGRPQPNTGATQFRDLLDQLSDYVWSNEEHRVVYQCLRSTRHAPAASLRAEMASVATRMGHPEVDWNSYFGRSAQNIAVADLIHRLKSNRM